MTRELDWGDESVAPRSGGTAEDSKRRLAAIKARPFLEGFTLLATFDVPDPPRLIVCPLPGHDEKTGSFSYGERGFFCHGCFPGEELVTTEEGLKPIALVRVGDFVLTDRGRFRPVLRVWTHRHAGEFVETSVSGVHAPVVSTCGHEFLATKAERQGRNPTRLRWPGEKGDARPRGSYSPQWVDSGDLGLDHLVYSPVVGGAREPLRHDPRRYRRGKGKLIKPIPEAYVLDRDLAWFLGLYVAEGSTTGGRTVNFTLHEQEGHLSRKVLEIAASTFGLSGRDVVRRDHQTRDVTICHAGLARWLEDLCGSGAANKRVPVEILDGSAEAREDFLHGYLTGDGTFWDATAHAVAVTVSPSLAHGVSLLAGSLGHNASVSFFPGGFRNGCNHRARYTVRVGKRPPRLIEGRVVRRVTGVRRFQDERDVYTLTVQEDHTYVVGGVVVKNCKRGGDLVGFVRETENLGWWEALERVERALGISTEPEAIGTRARRLAQEGDSAVPPDPKGEARRREWRARVLEIQ